MTSVVVCGASGFLGRHVVRVLAERGFAVYALTRREASFPAAVRSLRATDYSTVPAADVLVHFAEQSQIGQAQLDGVAYQRSCVELTERLLDTGSYGRFVYASSAAVYGDEVRQARRTDEAPSPKSLYAETKLACEKLVRRADGMVLRLANVVGPGMSAATVLADILGQIPGHGSLYVRDDTAVRDFLWIGDFTDCICRMLGAGAPAGTFNVGSGIGLSVRELASAALLAAGEAERPIVAREQSRHISQIVLDISATVATFSWRPATTIEMAVRRILQSRDQS